MANHTSCVWISDVTDALAKLYILLKPGFCATVFDYWTSFSTAPFLSLLIILILQCSSWLSLIAIFGHISTNITAFLHQNSQSTRGGGFFPTFKCTSSLPYRILMIDTIYDYLFKIKIVSVNVDSLNHRLQRKRRPPKAKT